MQQVGHYKNPNVTAAMSGNFATAATISSSEFAFPVKSAPRRIKIALARAWVLHQRFIVRLVGALALALVLAAGFQARGGIMQAASGVGDLLAGRFAQSGFAINEIAISGQVMARESDIAAALAINQTSNIFNFNVAAARQRIIDLPAVADVQIRKIYPSQLVVQVKEVTPVARWRIDGVTFVIDGNGNQIANATSADDNLPLVIGDGAANNAKAMIETLKAYPDLSKGLAALSRIGDRRWDLIYNNGLRIRLPEKGLGEALVQLEDAQIKDQLLERDLVLIDMRVAGQMALRLAKRNDG
ncbi:hypothetical protein MNBD_ALPHA12-2325 [hydrothermal vent metagenome]|uniref:POTRA domain-containing protein n=1 Tax=hydrothermal vent metagenome TaxID=652676 RepID=A0A3B0TJM1_9ZZZZ